ncbi:MAG: hypothetical protein AAFY65_00150 [Pseudomonadota bacterium]
MLTRSVSYLLNSLVAIFLLALPAAAQDPVAVDRAEGRSGAIEALADRFAQTGTDGADVRGPSLDQQVPTAAELSFPTLPGNYVPRAETLNAIDQSVRAYYDYRTQQFDHRYDVFRWQHLSTQIIFGVVVLIVFVGLYFSWVQFKRGEATGAGTGQTDFSAGKDGLKVSSPVLGVIILALSLVFFYLYLVYVYPITEVG